MSKMNFEKYQKLARKVFPTLPSNFEQLPDAIGTYQLVFTFVEPREVPDKSKWTDQYRIDHFSVSNWTVTKIRELTFPPRAR